MKKWRAILLTFGTFIALFVLSLYFYGLSQPEEHTASVTTELGASPDRVWAVITDYVGMAAWWDQVKAVEEGTLPDGTRVTWNTGADGERIGFVTVDEAPPRRLVRRIVDTGLPFGGEWIFELEPAEGNQTRLTLTERGFIRPPIFRAFAGIFMDQKGTMKSYLAALKQKLAASF